jgi:methionyl-tRNA synthetase
VATANLYIQQVAPWSLAKAGQDAELDAVLAALAGALHRLAVLTGPFIPGKARVLWQSLGLPREELERNWRQLDNPPVAGLATNKPEVLFPKPATV